MGDAFIKKHRVGDWHVLGDPELCPPTTCTSEGASVKYKWALLTGLRPRTALLPVFPCPSAVLPSFSSLHSPSLDYCTGCSDDGNSHVSFEWVDPRELENTLMMLTTLYVLIFVVLDNRKYNTCRVPLPTHIVIIPMNIHTMLARVSGTQPRPSRSEGLDDGKLV